MGIHKKGQPGTQGRTGKGKAHAGEGKLPWNKSAFRKFKSSQHGAHGGTHLIGGNGIVHRKAGNQVGRKGNKPAAAGDGIHKSRQHDQGTDNEVLEKYVHNDSPAGNKSILSS